MQISRRQFLQFCGAAAASLGLTQATVRQLEAALASDGAPTLIWLHGSGCQGDSISFLNLFDNVDPVGHLTVDQVLIQHVNLAYHTVVMSSAGETAWTMNFEAARKGGFVLVLEGGVPMAFDGRACLIATANGQEITYHDAIKDLAKDAAAVVCVGTCASYGGIPMSGPDPKETNPTGVIPCHQAVHALYPDKPVINIPGCPAHPDWVAWAVVQLILGNIPQLDPYLRPVEIYGNKDDNLNVRNIHEHCPRNPNKQGTGLATTFGQDGLCLEPLGCRGPNTFADCPTRRWNKGEGGAVNWCVDSNGLCLGCVEPDFPGGSFYEL